MQDKRTATQKSGLIAKGIKMDTRVEKSWIHEPELSRREPNSGILALFTAILIDLENISFFTKALTGSFS